MSDYKISNYDIEFTSPDFSIHDGLETAIWISLMTDCRADPEEIAEGENPRGTWFDYYEESVLGSKLWLLKKKPATEETRLLGVMYSEDALKWIVDKGIAKKIVVEADWEQRTTKTTLLLLDIKVYRPEGNYSFQYSLNWEAQLNDI